MDFKEAKFWEVENGELKCTLCPHNCIIPENKTGICGARKNINNKLVTLSYAEVISVSLDPIEKKPLYHFFPGKSIISTGPRGCNLACKYCQNWSISQKDGPTSHLEPEELIEIAIENNSLGIAYTYTEPTIAYEYVMDCARLAHQRGLFNVMVTNGFINPEPLETLLEFIDAFNIDLKSIRDGFYKQICNGKLKPVLDTIQSCYYNGNLIEITNLVIPEYNDTQEEISDLVDFIYSIDDKIPLHLSGYHPCYELNAPPTRVNQLRKAYDIAKEKLAYVYVGNRNTDWGNNTVCPSCGNLLVERSGFWSSIIGIDKAGRCNNCGRKVDIIGRWSLEN